MSPLPKMTPEERSRIASSNFASMKSSLNERQLGYLATTPPMRQYAYARALSGEGGLANAVKMKCTECVGFEDIQEQVGKCNCQRCPLHAYRPYQS